MLPRTAGKEQTSELVSIPNIQRVFVLQSSNVYLYSKHPTCICIPNIQRVFVFQSSNVYLYYINLLYFREPKERSGQAEEEEGGACPGAQLPQPPPSDRRREEQDNLHGRPQTEKLGREYLDGQSQEKHIIDLKHLCAVRGRYHNRNC